MMQQPRGLAKDVPDRAAADVRWKPERLDPSSYPDGVELPVFYNDLDTNAHINNVALGRYLEHGRFDAHRRHGINALVRPGNLLTARVAIDYLAEGHIGRSLSVRFRVSRIGRTSLVEEQGAWQGGVCIALAESVLVYVEDGRPAGISAELRAACESLMRT
ncbi:acyl-CoA thioesterase [Sporichthya polymorpha]|uniref:acyl-CoA thioesterase n=1 Tax=Sporichthya polymorpha TaxID=35751 RepID=UPI00036B62BD|nr:thioesterase family protein [Sporichthya polymorpha]